MSTISRTFRVDGVLANMTSVVLSDVTEAFGIKRNDTDAAVVADGTAMSNPSTGVYTYTFTDPAYDLEYTYSLEITYGGETHHVEYTMDGPATPADFLHSSIVTIRDWLGLEAAEDSDLAGLAAGFLSAAENYCGRHLKGQSRDVYVDGNAQEYLFLPEPAESIEAPRIDSDRDFEAGDALESDEYTLADDGISVRRLDSTWDTGTRNIKIVCTVGYATVPEDLLLAEKLEVGRLYAEKEQAETGDIVLKSQRVEAWATEFETREGLSDQAKALLDPHKVARL